MKDWFKARNIWGAALKDLPDDDAGKFAKALWLYTMTGEKAQLSGAAAGVFAIAVMTLEMDDDLAADISRKRAEAGAVGGKKKAANQANAIFATSSIANQANATIKNKNKNKEQESEIEKEEDINDNDIFRINEDHNEILDSAQAAGFDNQATWAKIIDLYAEYGREIVLAGISACVEQNVIKLSYLRKCCTNIASGNGKPAAGSKKNPFAELRGGKNDDQR